MAISKTEINEVMVKLESVEIQIMKLKAMLLTKSKPTKSEIKAIEEAKKEIAKGKWVTGNRLFDKQG